MKTELIIFHRPFQNILAYSNPAALELATSSNYVYTYKSNINKNFTKNFLQSTRPASSSSGGISIDLYDNVPIPITYTILDVREPEKRKTNWSKTITIPGTKNNNRIFDHIYELGADGWITIGGVSVYESFNPNLRLECILKNDGVQVLKGNLQLKKINRDANGNIEYEIALSGDLTSLFFDIGTSKLSDLDLSEWNHNWTKDVIEKSWQGVSIRNGLDYNSIVSSQARTITKIFQNAQSGRLSIQTSAAHNYSVDDWVQLDVDITNTIFKSCKGEWQVVEVISSTQFSVNYFYPLALSPTGHSGSLGTTYKRTASGRGYVYPMVSWGDEYDYNSFPTTAFIPGVYVKEIWDKIFKETNSTYTSEFLNSEFFKRLILLQKKSSYDINPSEYRSRKFQVGTTYSYLTGASYLGASKWVYTQVGTTSTATASIFARENPQNFPFVSESGGFATVSFFDNGLTSSASSYGNWDNTTYKWKVQDTGEYDLSTIIKLDCWAVINGFGITPGSGTQGMTPSIYRYYPGNGSERYGPGYDSGPGPFSSSDGNTFGVQVKGTLKRLRDGVVSEIGTGLLDFKMNSQSYWTPTNPNWENFGKYYPESWKNAQLNITSSSKYFKQNDEVWLELSHYVQANQQYQTVDGRKLCFCFNQSGGPEIVRSVLGDFYLKVNEQSFIYNEPSPRTFEGSELEINSVLPKDMDCKDFLVGIIKMFNLHIKQDSGVDRKYLIEPRDDFYYTGSTQSEFVDWTDKIDNSSIEIIPLGELIAKYYIFENKEESDYWNKRFKEDRGRAYQYYRKEINNDFLKNESKISVPFGSSVMINNPAGSDVVMPSIYQRESNGTAKPVSNSQPRILIWGGLRPYTAQRGGSRINLSNSYFPDEYGWEILSGSNSAVISASSSRYEQYPYAGTVDSPQDPVNDINWYNMEEGDFVYYDYARWTNANLYNKYWSNFINEVSDPASKVVICSIRLTPKDIFNLDFRKIYLIDGHYLRLQKIVDYDPVSDGLTKCEFLKIKSPTKFSQQSQLVEGWGTIDYTFSTNVDSTRPVPVSVSMVAPQRKRPEFGFNNNVAGINLSNSLTIQTNGLSNFIAPGSKNITITGNENSIGNGAENVSIQGGSGNYILGGVKNVNIIGTDKKYVSESNITYINGIRYVNGLPVSKSNVINGGLDIAVVRQSASTTPTTIDAGEDVVIQAGSQTFENVINSGQDAILPDLQQLGLTTVVNPNPRTNLSAGFDSNFATASFVDVIRARSAER